jgi:hypothetical protein
MHAEQKVWPHATRRGARSASSNGSAHNAHATSWYWCAEAALRFVLRRLDAIEKSENGL